MPDPLRPVRPGMPIPRDAETWNAVLDAARANQAKRSGGPGATVARSPIVPHAVASFRYDEADTEVLPEFSAVAYGPRPAGLPALDDEPAGANADPVFDVAVPTGPDDVIAVTLEPIEGGSVGRAATAGIAVVKLQVNLATHPRAVPVAGETAFMETAATGGYPILAMGEEGESGTAWAQILLDRGGDGDGATPNPSDPVPTVTPLNCPVDPPEPAECCLPDDPECCPEIFIAFENADRGTLYTNHAFMDYYYYDCDQRQQFFNSESDPELFERCVDTPVTITCPPAPLTLEDRFYFQDECRTCDQIHAIDPDYVCTPPTIKGPVCVTLSGRATALRTADGIGG
ncbi:hypothetical protein J0H58_21580 [bacterium]|nr:hypothetical protein [bacterium]